MRGVGPHAGVAILWQHCHPCPCPCPCGVRLLTLVVTVTPRVVTRYKDVDFEREVNLATSTIIERYYDDECPECVVETNTPSTPHPPRTPSTLCDV